MQLRDQADHIALLSLMIVGQLAKRLIEVDQLDRETSENIHRLVQGVRIHAKNAGLSDLNVLFDNIDRTLANCGMVCAIGMMLTLVLVYESPFSGDISVAPTALKRVIETFMVR